MFRPVLRTLKPIKLMGRRSASSNTGGGVSSGLPTSTIVASLFGIGSAAYAYELGHGNGRTAVSTQSATLSKPKYGGPEEVRRAIAELQETLPDQVRVDAPTIEAYGSSPNSYVPGTPHAVYVA